MEIICDSLTSIQRLIFRTCSTELIINYKDLHYIIFVVL